MAIVVASRRPARAIESTPPVKSTSNGAPAVLLSVVKPTPKASDPAPIVDEAWLAHDVPTATVRGTAASPKVSVVPRAWAPAGATRMAGVVPASRVEPSDPALRLYTPGTRGQCSRSGNKPRVWDAVAVSFSSVMVRAVSVGACP